MVISKTDDQNFLLQICPTVGTDKSEQQGDGFCRRNQQSSSNAVSISFFTHQYLRVWYLSESSHVTILCCGIGMCTDRNPTSVPRADRKTALFKEMSLTM